MDEINSVKTSEHTNGEEERVAPKIEAPVYRTVHTPKNRSGQVLEKKVSISLKTVVFIVLLVAVFLAGRYVFPGEPIIERFGNPDSAVVGDVASVLEDDDAVLLDEIVVEDDTEEVVVNNSANDTEETGEEEKDDTEEVIITEGYDNVDLKFSRTPSFEWKGTWGRVETIYYEITNNESGTIQPAYFTVVIEGYESEEPKEVTVPTLDQSIAAGEVVQHGFDVDTSYSETVTDPSNLKITLRLFDESEDLIGMVIKEFDMGG